MTQRTAKLLSGYGPSERREHLKRYLVTCVRDNVLSFTEITSAPDKIMRTITSDITALVVDLKKTAVDFAKAGAGGVLKAAGGALAEIAQDVVAGRRK